MYRQRAPSVFRAKERVRPVAASMTVVFALAALPVFLYKIASHAFSFPRKSFWTLILSAEYGSAWMPEL